MEAVPLMMVADVVVVAAVEAASAARFSALTWRMSVIFVVFLLVVDKSKIPGPGMLTWELKNSKL